MIDRSFLSGDLAGRAWRTSVITVMAVCHSGDERHRHFFVDNAQLLFSRSGIRGYHRGAAFGPNAVFYS